MSKQVIFSAPYGEVLVDEQVPCVITHWTAFANRTEFIALQEAALIYYEQHSTPAQPWGWVGDVRSMGAIPEEAQRWLQQEFNPRALAAGLRVVSVVVAESVFGQLATQRYAQDTARNQEPGTLLVEYYPSLLEAKYGAKQALK